MDDFNELKLLRRKIRDVTEKIILFSGERIELARRTGVIKRKLGISLEDPEVENQLKKDVVRLCEDRNINVELGLKLLKLLVEEAKRTQEKEHNHLKTL